MKKDPFISICIPCYNQGNFLKEALLSAISQINCRFEVCVSNNASTDSTAKVMQDFSLNNQVRIKHHPELLPMTTHWNSFRNWVKGDWILFLCADDLLESFCIEKCLNTLKKVDGNVVCVFFEYDYIDELGIKKKKVNFYEKSAAIKSKNQFEIFIGGNNFPLSTCLINRHYLDKINWFDASFNFCSDWDLWLGLTGYFYNDQVIYINEKLALYRKHSSNETTSCTSTLMAIEEVDRMKKKHIGYFPCKDQQYLIESGLRGSLKLTKIYLQMAQDANNLDLITAYKERCKIYIKKLTGVPDKPKMSGPPFQLPQASKPVI